MTGISEAAVTHARHVHDSDADAARRRADPISEPVPQPVSPIIPVPGLALPPPVPVTAEAPGKEAVGKPAAAVLRRIAARRARPGDALPAPISESLERRAGLDLSDVRVHRNSARPAAIGALAYTQGDDIYLGAGQERHLGHEAWHVIQQRQGRVRATSRTNTGLPLNDDAHLEHEASAAALHGGPTDVAADSASVPSTGVVQGMFTVTNNQITTLAGLNQALGLPTPPAAGVAAVPAMTPADFNAPGLTAALADRVIAANTSMVWQGMQPADVVAELRDAMRAAVDSTPPGYEYETHGDKHFPGKVPGTKFSSGKDVINPILERMMTAEIGRIRRHANGAKRTYYISDKASPVPKAPKVVIQATYHPADDTISYHGYPHNQVTTTRVSLTLGGADIPQ